MTDDAERIVIPDWRTLDEADLDDDLLKASPWGWDIHPPEADRLLEVLKLTGLPLAEQRAGMAEFVRKPAAQAMPNWVQDDLMRMGILDAMGGHAAAGFRRPRPGPPEPSI